MSDPTTESHDAQAAVAAWWHVVRVLDEPAAVFQALRARPRLLAPIVAVVATFVVFGFVTPADQLQEQARQQVEVTRNRIRQMPDEQRQQIESTMQARIDRAGSTASRATIAVFGSITSLIGFLIVSGILMLVFGAMGSQSIGFKSEFAVVAHAFVPQLVGLLLTVALAFAGLTNVQLSLGFLSDIERSPFLFTLFSQFSLFAAWNVYLLALGNQLLVGGKGIGGPLSVVAGLWVLKNVVVAGGVGMFAGLAG